MQDKFNSCYLVCPVAAGCPDLKLILNQSAGELISSSISINTAAACRILCATVSGTHALHDRAHPCKEYHANLSIILVKSLPASRRNRHVGRRSRCRYSPRTSSRDACPLPPTSRPALPPRTTMRMDHPISPSFRPSPSA